MVENHRLDAVDPFTYLGSVITTSCDCAPDVNRRIGIASSSMGKLALIWSSTRFSIITKLRIYNALILSIILYGAATWTLSRYLTKRLDAFDTQALRRILGIRWPERVSNVEVRARTRQPPLTLTIAKARLGLFGHIARLPLNTDIRVLLGSEPCREWLLPRGRPRLRWLDQVSRDTGLSKEEALVAARDRQRWRGLVRDATRLPAQAN